MSDAYDRGNSRAKASLWREAFLVLLAVYYFAWAKGRFRGPVAQGSVEQLSDIEKEFQTAAGDIAG